MAKKDARMLRFVIPIYNEQDNVRLLIENTVAFCQRHGHDYQIVAVNDGSTDATPALLKDFAQKFPIVVLDQEFNKGVGLAFKRGFAYVNAFAGDNDIIITKEADNTSDLAVLSEMINKVCAGYDLVLASCYMPGGGIEGTTLYRKILSAGANIMLRTFTPLKKIYTFSSFYRVYKSSLLKKASYIYGDKLIEEKGFVCMVELLLKLSALKIKIAEVPMVLKGDLRQGKSKMKTIKNTCAYLKLIMKNFRNNYYHGF